MSEQTTEADARIRIDDLLKEALWDPADKSQVLTDVYIQQIKGSVFAEFRATEV